jgi:hypothetical protein
MNARQKLLAYLQEEIDSLASWVVFHERELQTKRKSLEDLTAMRDGLEGKPAMCQSCLQPVHQGCQMPYCPTRLPADHPVEGDLGSVPL